jgi:uncharacterized protein (TIGR02466 family)
MRLENWFPTTIYYGLCNDINIDELINYSYYLKNQSQGRVTTNQNAWQSLDLNLSLDVLQPLLKQATKHFQILHKELGYKNNLKSIIDNMWININPPGGLTRTHTHVDNILSGVFFLKVRKDCGRLVFPHPLPHALYHFHHKTVEIYNEKNSNFCYHIPQVGKIILFPSFAQHFVETNLSNEDRISIAFNTKLINA